MLGVSRCENSLYVLDQHHHALVSIISANKPHVFVHLWHARLDHPNYRIVASLSRIGSISCSNKPIMNDSNICVVY